MYNKINTFGVYLSDKIAEFGGSWTFLIMFTSALVIWITYNLTTSKPFDVYPFILLNLMFSALAAYQAPIILMAANRQATKDREALEEDLRLTREVNSRLLNIEKVLMEKR